MRVLIAGNGFREWPKAAYRRLLPATLEHWDRIYPEGSYPKADRRRLHSI